MSKRVAKPADRDFMAPLDAQKKEIYMEIKQIEKLVEIQKNLNDAEDINTDVDFHLKRDDEIFD